METSIWVLVVVVTVVFTPLLLALFVCSIAILVDVLDDLCNSFERFWRKHV